MCHGRTVGAPAGSATTWCDPPPEAPSGGARAVGLIAQEQQRPSEQLGEVALLAGERAPRSSRSVATWPSTTSSTRWSPAGVRRTITLRRSPAVAPLHEAALLEAVDAVRDGTGRDHGLADEIPGRELVGLARAPQRGQDVVHPALDAVAGEALGQPPVDEPRQPRDATDHVDGRHVHVGPHRTPLAHDAVDRVVVLPCHAAEHTARCLDSHHLDIKITNMKGSEPDRGTDGRTTLLAPITWGTTYVTVTELLPAGRPLLVATVRVVPAGLALLAIGTLTSRWRPRGAEWWRTGALAACNFGFSSPCCDRGVPPARRRGGGRGRPAAAPRGGALGARDRRAGPGGRARGRVVAAPASGWSSCARAPASTPSGYWRPSAPTSRSPSASC